MHTSFSYSNEGGARLIELIVEHPDDIITFATDICSTRVRKAKVSKVVHINPIWDWN